MGEEAEVEEEPGEEVEEEAEEEVEEQPLMFHLIVEEAEAVEEERVEGEAEEQPLMFHLIEVVEIPKAQRTTAVIQGVMMKKGYVLSKVMFRQTNSPSSTLG